MSMEIELQESNGLKQVLEGLPANKLLPAIRRATKRASTSARTSGTKRLRSIYTIHASDLKARSLIKKVDDGALLKFRGGMEPVTKYRAQERASGIFVSVKRGGGKKVARSFSLKGRFVAREGKERYPIKGLYGPAVPQLFENQEVMDTMEKRGSEILEKRLEHELDLILKGTLK